MEMSHDHPVLITLPQINRFSQSYVDHLELKTFIDLCRVKIPFSGGNISCIIVLCNLGKLASLNCPRCIPCKTGNHQDQSQT